VAGRDKLEIGAGEGNRALVFSLEGFRRLNTFNAHSDKKRHFHSLIALPHLTAFDISEIDRDLHEVLAEMSGAPL